VSLSVVIVTYRSDRCIEAALASVRSQLPGEEIVVVDNASDDETRAIVRSFGGVRLIAHEENVGFGRACNTGARHATGTRVLFVNPDVRIVSADPAELSGSGPNGFGLLGGYLAADPGSVPEDSLRGERHWLHDYVGQTLGLLRPREWHRSLGSGGANRPWIPGALLLVDKEEFLDLGGFDPRFFLYYEDKELSSRYRKANLPIRTSPTLVATHAVTGSSRGDDLRIDLLGWRFLAWIEYLHISEGPRSAGRAAMLTRATLRILSTVVGGLARAGLGSRAQRKDRQIKALLAFVHGRQADVEPGSLGTFCPDAVAHLRGQP
jgi:N-acetylglucosaminyl-diphospho-decaprenol L-rhamnosyltransferase